MVSLPTVLRHTHSVADFMAEIPPAARVLNAGSASVRLGDALNVDLLPKPGIDARADVHHLPFRDASFDAVVLSAVLQYCQRPRAVAVEIARVLKPGGLVYVDAPFVQPYCPDTPDLWRFTAHGLREIFGTLEIEACGTSIPTGPAIAFLVQRAALRSAPRPAHFVVAWVASVLALPLRWMGPAHTDVAGALYLIGRRM